MLSVFSKIVLNNSFKKQKPNILLGLSGLYFLKLFFVLKNKENKENMKNTFGSFLKKTHKKTLNSDNKNIFQKT